VVVRVPEIFTAEDAEANAEDTENSLATLAACALDVTSRARVVFYSVVPLDTSHQDILYFQHVLQ
jgi:hypothetical protein